MQLYFPGRILQLKAEHKGEADRWLACLHSLHLIAVNSSFTKIIKTQQNAAQTSAKGLRQHDSAASVAGPCQKPIHQPDDGVLFIKVDATYSKPSALEQHGSGQLSHLSVDRSRLSFTPLSDHAAKSPFLAQREQHASSLQADIEPASCARCKSMVNSPVLKEVAPKDKDATCSK